MNAIALSRPANSRTINVRLPMDIFERLEALATSTARTRSFVAIEALATYLETQAWQVKEVEIAIDEANDGQFATQAQVNAVFAKYGA